MRNASADTSTSLSVGIFSVISVSSASSLMASKLATFICPSASVARSAWLFCAERATEKNRNIGMVFSGLPNNQQHL